MKIALALLLALAGCRGADLAPDEFRFDVGRGHTDMDSHTTTTPGWWDPSRSFDSSGDSTSQFFSVGWTWYLGKKDRPEHEPAYYAAMREPAVVPPPSEPEPAPEPKHEEAAPEPKKESGGAWWTGALPYIPALVLAIIGLLNRLGKIDVLSHKEH